VKYCRICKTRAGDAESVCAKCGSPLAVLGGATSGGPGGGDTAAPGLTLQGQIRELQETQRKNVQRSRALGLIAALVTLAILLTVFNVYRLKVLSYAVIRDVEIEQDAASDRTIRVAFDVVTPGKVSYDRSSGGSRMEKVDVFAEPGRKQLTWTWPADAATGIDFRVGYRGGLTRAAETRHFDVGAEVKKTAHVDVLFLLDTTISMNEFITGLKRKAIDFASIVRREGHDCRLGLIGFGDVDYREPMEVFEPTADIQEFQTKVELVPRTKGGDEPESSLEAIDAGLKLDFREGATVCFVLITDADYKKNSEQLRSGLISELKRRGIVVYVVSRENWRDRYTPLCVNGGRFHAIEDAQFEQILTDLARSITNQIRSR
jgi:hypothetical protein